MSAYAAALKGAVQPGMTVVDIGAGPGVFAILACQYGAGRVIAVDPSESVELILPLAEANGCADRISVVRGLSTDLASDTKADVIVSDLRGTLPLFEGHITAIVDARERLLVPGGTLIPSKDTLFVALVADPEHYSAFEHPWRDNRFGLNLEAGHRYAVNSFMKVSVQQDALLSSPQELGVLDYCTIQHSDLDGSVDLEVEKEGTAHGLLVWFDAELAPGTGFSNAPGEPPQVYGQSFFPFERPVQVSAGGRVTAQVSARQIDGEYVWAWTSAFRHADGDAPHAQFRQSTFLAKVFAPEQLARRSESSVPSTHPLQQVDRFSLGLFDGSRTLGDMADELRRKFPDTFSSPAKALDHIARIAARYPNGDQK